MFCEGIKTKRYLSYILICSLSILYNSKFILMAASLESNTIIVTRVHYIVVLYSKAQLTSGNISFCLLFKVEVVAG